MISRINHSNPLAIAILGVSQTEVCGVRDYAIILGNQLRSLGYEVSLLWADMSDHRTVGHFALGDMIIRAADADIILLNYSVFAAAWHGLPLSVPLLAWRLWRAPSAVVIVGHEMVYPWRHRGWRGFIHATTQRVALLPLIAVSTLVVVTTEERRCWLRSRRWLPSRPVVFAPVFSNVPVRSQSGVSPNSPSLTVGVFGYGHESQHRELVVRAVAGVASILEGVELVLIGGAGQCSMQGITWQDSARASGCPHHFTGTLSPDELSRELSNLGVLVFFDEAGPTSRKGTLAAALAHGVPTIALDGPSRWREFVDSGAVEVTAPEAKALERHLLALLTDPVRRARLGKAARNFYDRCMTAEVVALEIADAIEAVMRTEVPGCIASHAMEGRSGDTEAPGSST